jgi:hypothetical protein
MIGGYIAPVSWRAREREPTWGSGGKAPHSEAQRQSSCTSRELPEADSQSPKLNRHFRSLC